MNSKTENTRSSSRKPLFIVTIATRGYDNVEECEMEVFDTSEGANRWIESQIQALKRKHGKTNPNFAVDGWHVQLDGWRSTIQFDIVEKELREAV